MELIVTGINHRSADVNIREQYAVARDDVPVRLNELMAHDGINEAVLLSTCNRVEVYVVPADGASKEDVAAAARAVLGPQANAFYTHFGRSAVEHLFRVSSSLDSMIVGEPQILGQVKEALAIAKRSGSVGYMLNRCFDHAFKAAKRVRTHTGIARSAVSVGHVAVELAKTIFGAVTEIKVLVIGVGKMGILAAQRLADSGAREVVVTNRTYEKAVKLAKRHGWSASDYQSMPRLLQDADVVICSTGSPTPVLTVDLVQQSFEERRYRPLFLIDIAVPRDIENGCADLDNVYLYNIDDLEEVSRTNTELREAEIAEAESEVEGQLQVLERRLSERRAVPIIRALREKSLGIALDESEKTLKLIDGLDEESSAKVQKLAEVIASRLTRGTVTALKNAAGGPGITDLAEQVCELFELELDESE